MAKLSIKEREWVQLRQRYNLTHAQVQMARELDIVPRSLAKLTDMSVPTYVQRLYFEEFGRQSPKVVLSIEERAKQEQKEKAMQKVNRLKPGPKSPLAEEVETVAPPRKASRPAPKPRKKNRPHVSIPPRGRDSG